MNINDYLEQQVKNKANNLFNVYLASMEALKQAKEDEKLVQSQAENACRLVKGSVKERLAVFHAIKDPSTEKVARLQKASDDAWNAYQIADSRYVEVSGSSRS